eukprot:TRINITY_DN11532_c0_g1_i2.p1 TRINITY_DN11532_c0_g1~~TRINITY_DN11532_c0_g1_i2.p1  ORF type:complete len:104 (+),score=6.19 TRINITY_DN11532_c0_g1_i2:544-855(+)
MERTMSTRVLRCARFLISFDLWDLVSCGYTGVTYVEAFPSLLDDRKKEIRELPKQDAKALYILQSAFHSAFFPKIAEVKFAKVAWETLETAYKGSANGRMIKL